MNLVNVFAFYDLARNLRRLDEIHCSNALSFGENGTSHWMARSIAIGAYLSLHRFTESGTYKVKTAKTAQTELMKALNEFINTCKDEIEKNQDSIVGFGATNQIREALLKFENVLGAELGQAGFFVAEQKAAFDTSILISEGHRAFPSELTLKCPDQELDARQAMRCIAFDLPTAAAFHLHRLNEGVLGKYWDTISGGEQRPKGLGKYIEALEKRPDVDQNLTACIRDIKNLHRNPVLHPEQVVATVEEAIVLHGIVSSAIAAMLPHIPRHVEQSATTLSSGLLGTLLAAEGPAEKDIHSGE